MRKIIAFITSFILLLSFSIPTFAATLDENGEAAMKYGISSIPNVLAFKGGKVVGGSLGFVPASALSSFVEKYL